MNKRLYEDSWDILGVTPLISLTKLVNEDFKGKIYGKLESYNPTGLFTDRIAQKLFELLKEQNKLQDNKFLVDIYKPNFSLSFSSKAIQCGFKVVVFYEAGSDSKELRQLSFLGCHLHECCSKREMLKEMNDFKDNNVCININEEFNTQKEQLKTSIIKEIEEQIDGKVDYLIVNQEWKDFLQTDHTNIKTVSSKLQSNSDIQISLTSDQYSKTAQKFLQSQGKLLGQKSTLALTGALQLLSDIQDQQDKNFIVLLDDSNNNLSNQYISQVQRACLNQDQAQQQTSFKNKTIEDIITLQEEPYYDKRMTIGDCFEILKKGKKCVPIREGSKILGVVDCNSLRKNFLQQNLDKNNSCVKCLKNDFFELPYDSNMVQIEKALEENQYILLTQRQDENVKKLFVLIAEDLLLILNDKMQLIL